MHTPTTSLDLNLVVTAPFETTYERARIALKAAGFEIAAEIDLGELLAKKTSSFSRLYKVIVACNLDLVQRAMTIVPQIGVLLPCNIVVTQLQDDRVEISIADPVITWEAVPDPYLKPIATELSLQLRRVIEALKE